MKKIFLIFNLLNILGFTQEYAIKFDGIDDYISLNSGTSLDINSTNSEGLTVEFWINLNSYKDQKVFDRMIPNFGGYSVRVDSEGILYFEWVRGWGTTSLGNNSTKLSTGVWTHVAAQIDGGSREAKIFINGVMKTYISGTQLPRGLNNARPAIIGSDLVTQVNFLDGTLDEMRISNIARYFNDFTPPQKAFESDSNTKGLFHFNEGTGTTTADASGNNNNGTLTNGPLWVEGFFSGSTNNPPLAPSDLKCNGFTNPAGITDTNPDLSWVFNDTDIGDEQSAYRILVANDYALLVSDTGNMWDTSKVYSSVKNITYSGQALASGLTYYWKVKTWDKFNSESSYSEINHFSMAGTQQPNNPPNAPSNLLCNGQSNPKGITDTSPNFSWIFSDPDSGDFQSAYQVLVADNLTYLNNNQGNFWDTGKVFSGVNNVNYAGISLSYGSTYYWKIRVWDNHDAVSQYSSVANFSLAVLLPPVTGYFASPYGVNNWTWPSWACNRFKDAYMNRYRIMCYWRDMEPSDNSYNWSRVDAALDNAKNLGAKISLCVYDSPDWARQDKAVRLSYNPSKYAEFITALLQHCESRRSGVVEAVEIENEGPTGEGTWIESRIPVHGTHQRDPSWFYAAILRAGYNAVKSFNPNLLVIADGIWAGAYHHLDELYQLGLKDYFDRVNLHHYLMDFGPEDPNDTSSIWHFGTVISYLKYITEQNHDSSKLMWLTEFGWRITDFGWPRDIGEVKKADYTRSLLDICRKSGFVEKADIYVGTASGYPSSHDTIALIYSDQDWVENPSIIINTTAYYTYVDYGKSYPNWDYSGFGPIPTLTPASSQVNIVNAGFELGNTTGWTGPVVDTAHKHSGNYSGKVIIPNGASTQFYNVEPNRAYEVVVWVKVESSSAETGIIFLRIDENGTIWEPPNYWGIVDTRNYPGTWRRLRFMYLVPPDRDKIAVNFISQGSGTYWIDDIQIKPLNLPSTSPGTPVLLLDTYQLNFGEIPTDQNRMLAFRILNGSGGTLSGNITPDKNWITTDISNFIGNDVMVNVTVENIYVISGEPVDYSGKIIINSNGGDAEVTIYLTATCVIVRPNPYEPEKGLLQFYGNGIIPGETKITIWTLSGEKVWENKDNIFVWDGYNSKNKPVLPGVYIYTYESSSEKGVGKFTVK